MQVLPEMMYSNCQY